MSTEKKKVSTLFWLYLLTAGSFVLLGEPDKAQVFALLSIAAAINERDQ